MATPTIPISQIVNVLPGVVSAGGNPLSLNSIFISKDARVPKTNILEFPSLADVSDYFGSNALETRLAGRYFAGFDSSTRKPGTLFVAGYADVATPAWLRGASISGTTLAQLKAITGTLSVTVDGVAYSAASLNLSTATDFTNAASLIQTALAITTAATVTWDALNAQFVITTVANGALKTITYATGTAAAPLGLSSGVITSGVAIDTPASAMDRIKAQTQNWAAFMTVFSNTTDDKEAFARWCSNQNNRYAYVAWDDVAGYSTPNNATTFGNIVDVKNYEGTVVIYNNADIGAFVCGFIGSINWQELNGRATPAFKQQSGLETSVNTLALASAVLSNNASYFGLYQAPGQGNIYSILYDGRMNGSKFRWLDTYVNQIYLNAQLQQSIFNGLLQVRSAPYNSQGETLIRAWCADPITEALNNGSIRTGVALSESQKAAIAMDAGLDISDQLYGQGYYLQILPATAQIRQQRQSPPVKLWYMDGGSIQAISLASIAVL